MDHARWLSNGDKQLTNDHEHIVFTSPRHRNISDSIFEFSTNRGQSSTQILASCLKKGVAVYYFLVLEQGQMIYADPGDSTIKCPDVRVYWGWQNAPILKVTLIKKTYP